MWCVTFIGWAHAVLYNNFYLFLSVSEISHSTGDRLATIVHRVFDVLRVACAMCQSPRAVLSRTYCHIASTFQRYNKQFQSYGLLLSVVVVLCWRSTVCFLLYNRDVVIFLLFRSNF